VKKWLDQQKAVDFGARIVVKLWPVMVLCPGRARREVLQLSA
jgi:hypothetical protein